KLGNVVYRVVGSKYVVAPAPNFAQVEWSPAQQRQRQTLKDAAARARIAFLDPAVKEAYQSRARELGLPLYAVAYQDYQRGPCIEAIDLAGYTGHAGEQIKIRLNDPFEGYRVEVSIRSGAGDVLESGPAARLRAAGTEWIYGTQADATGHAEVLVEAIAFDRPGNRDARLQLAW
ncbi:MAG: hypothetical protein U1G07_24950, partial [Verrucomicrobiota bacterium]